MLAQLLDRLTMACMATEFAARPGLRRESAEHARRPDATEHLDPTKAACAASDFIRPSTGRFRQNSRSSCRAWRMIPSPGSAWAVARILEPCSIATVNPAAPQRQCDVEVGLARAQPIAPASRKLIAALR